MITWLFRIVTMLTVGFSLLACSESYVSEPDRQRQVEQIIANPQPPLTIDEFLSINEPSGVGLIGCLGDNKTCWCTDDHCLYLVAKCVAHGGTWLGCSNNKKLCACRFNEPQL